MRIGGIVRPQNGELPPSLPAPLLASPDNKHQLLRPDCLLTCARYFFEGLMVLVLQEQAVVRFVVVGGQPLAGNRPSGTSRNRRPRDPPGAGDAAADFYFSQRFTRVKTGGTPALQDRGSVPPGL